MTVKSPPEGPFVLAGPATDVEAAKLRHSAASFRRLLDSLMGQTQGVVYQLNSGLELRTSVTGSDGNVTIAAGACYVRGTQASDQGMYHLYNDAALVINVLGANPAHASLNRIDLVVARIQDSFYSGSADTASIEMVTGTPSATPIAPTPPANTLVLTQLSVPAAVSVLLASYLTDLRVPAGRSAVKLYRSAGATPYPYDWQNIPPGFNALEVRAKLRTNGTFNGFGQTQIRFNGDSSASYDSDYIGIAGTTFSVTETQSPASPGTAGICCFSMGGGIVNVNAFCRERLWIVSYDDICETIVSGHTHASTGTHVAGSDWQYHFIMNYRQTAVINRIQFGFSTDAGATAWNAGSWAELWGHA
jgi:hypothetical protein